MTHINRDKVISCHCKIDTIFGMSNEIIECNACNKYQHKACLSSLVKMEIYICPMCQFYYSDPFIHPVQNIFLSSGITFDPIPNKTSQLDQSTKILHQVKQIDFSIDIEQLKSHPEYNIYSSFIMINCLQLDTKGFTYQWPMNGFIKINKKLIYEVPQNFNPNRNEPLPIFLTFCAKIQKKVIKLGYKYYPYDQNIYRIKEYLTSSDNTLDIGIYKSKKATNATYLINVDFIKVMNEEHVVNSIIKISDTKALQKYQKKEGSEQDIKLFLEEVSLKDIYMDSMRIIIPARSLNCLHMGVFDLKNFLSLNRKARKYKCPICGKNARILYIDEPLKELFKKNPQAEKLLLKNDYSFANLNNNIAQPKEDKLLLNNPVNQLLENRSKIKSNNDENIQIEVVINEVLPYKDNSLPKSSNANSRNSIIDIKDNANPSLIKNSIVELLPKQKDNNISQNTIITNNEKENDDITASPYEENNISLPIPIIPLSKEKLNEYNAIASKNIKILFKNTNLIYLNSLQQIFSKEQDFEEKDN